MHITVQLTNFRVFVLKYAYHKKMTASVVGFPGYRSRGPDSILGTTRFFSEVVGLERGPLSLVSTIEELLERNSG
jgi:hypothetical protein